MVVSSSFFKIITISYRPMPCVDRGLAFEQYMKILNLPEVWEKKSTWGSGEEMKSPTSALIKFCHIKFSDRKQMIEINKTETFIHISSKALTTIPFNIFGGSKCKSTVIQHEMCLLHCNLAAEKQTTLAYIIFFLLPLTLSVCKQTLRTVL